MILDSIKYADRYANLNERLTKGLRFLSTHDFAGDLPGEHKIDGDELYYSVRIYETKPESELKWENHRKYIDIQCVLDGEETIAVTDLSSLAITKEYAPDSDVEFLGGSIPGSKLQLRPGVFAVLFPGEGHKPGVMSEKIGTVKKVVFKVLAD